jgi:hypothetical protein
MDATYAVLGINAHRSFGAHVNWFGSHTIIQQRRNAAPACSFGSRFCSDGAPPLPQPCSPHLVAQLLHPLINCSGGKVLGVHSSRRQRWRTRACRRQPEGVKRASAAEAQRCVSMATESQLLVPFRFRADIRRSSSRSPTCYAFLDMDCVATFLRCD